MAGAAGLVDMSLWDTDRAALVAQVAAAAKDTGFLQACVRLAAQCRNKCTPLTPRTAHLAQVYNHGVPQADIDAAFAASAAFFALPDDVKARTPFAGWAGGWEKEQQVRCCCARAHRGAHRDKGSRGLRRRHA